jgi:hypothetical protein
MAKLLLSELFVYCFEDGFNCSNCRLHSSGKYYTLCSYHEGWVDGIDAKFAQISKIMDKEMGK